MKVRKVLIAIFIIALFTSSVLVAEIGGNPPMLSTLRKKHPGLIALDSDVPRVRKLVETKSTE